MILRGILDSSLNGQLCIRGFAPIKELARISEADYSYQRKPIEEHKDEIIDFLDNESYLFFPEVILSYKIKHAFGDLKNNETPIQKLQLFQSYKSSIDNTQIKVKRNEYKDSNDSRGRNYLTFVELILDDNELNKQIEDHKHPFHRIDGNHRLKAASLSDTDKVKRMVAPFCILIGEEFYEKNILLENTTTNNFNKSVKVFFHNINTKTTPLTSEENLKVMIDDYLNFPDEELERIIGLFAVKTRQLIKKVNPDIFTGIEHILLKQYRTYYNDVFNRLLTKGIPPEKVVSKVFESIKAIDNLYNESNELKANSSFGLLTAFLYYHTEDNKGKFNLFKKWVFNNHIFEIKEIKTESIIKIFDKIAEQEITVFVAMPYFEHNPNKIKGYNLAYNRVIERLISENNSLKLSLFPIMEHIGRTKDIVANFINQIKECKIFIADISEQNPNVAYELGFARSLEKPTILLIKSGETIPFDYNHDNANHYNGSGPLNDLEEIVYTHIKGILQKDYGLIVN
nr:hypothetical protein [Flavobacterium sp. ASV13]